MSPELQAWLEKRDQYLYLKRRIADDGGHIMLRNDCYDPDALEEPLRSEAKAYFEEANLGNHKD